MSKITEFSNTVAVLTIYMTLDFKTNSQVDISDHNGKLKPFSRDCLGTETKKKMKNAEFSSRNIVPSFHYLRFFSCFWRLMAQWKSA